MLFKMEKIFNYKYLTKGHLKGFNNYKYSAIDTSPLSNYVMHPIWNNSVKILPKWLAPNLITFMGFFLMVGLVALLGVYDYGCRGPTAAAVPSWVYTTCAVFLFVAYNLGLLLVVSVSLNFYVSHWEKYNTGILYLPWGYDISMWATSILFLIPGIYGPTVYHTYVFGHITFAQALEVVVHATGLLTTLPIAVNNVYLARKNRTAIQKSLIQALRPVWSMLLMNVAIIAWAIKSPGNILEYDPKAFVLLYGTYFSNISCRLIVAEMSKQRCDVITWMCWPLLAGVAVSLTLPNLEVPMMYTLLLFSLAGHMHYGICVVRQLCAHYGINCFTVPKAKRK